MCINDLWEEWEECPDDSADFFRFALDRLIKSQPRRSNLAQGAALWLIYAKFPITIDELQYGIAVDREEGTLKFESDRIVPDHHLLTVCCGFVRLPFDKETRLVKFIRQYNPLS